MVLIRQVKLQKLASYSENQRDALYLVLTRFIKKDLSLVLAKHHNTSSEFTSMIHDRFLENILDKGVKCFEGAKSLDNIFFWDYLVDDVK